MKKVRKGFTLAEILLTLTIIGVVASITIPTLVNSVQEDQFKVAWKKAFSDISQSTALIINANGGNLKSAFSDSNVMRNEYAKYLNGIKSCTQAITEGCWYSSGKFLNGNTWNPSNEPGLILNNGSMIKFYLGSSGCTESTMNIARCGTIGVDTNGMKGPNTWGKDVFSVHVTENGIKPMGTQGDVYSTNSLYSCNPSNQGQQCSVLYLYQ